MPYISLPYLRKVTLVALIGITAAALFVVLRELAIATMGGAVTRAIARIGERGTIVAVIESEEIGLLWGIVLALLIGALLDVGITVARRRIW